jgi:plastocyanin
MRLLLALPLFLAPVQEKAVVSGKVTVASGAKANIAVIKYTGPDQKLLKPAPVSSPVVWLEGMPSAPPVKERTAEVRQEGLQFRPRSIAVQTGTTVKFPCEDKTIHNVFALRSPTKFDLGKHGSGAAPQQDLPDKGLVHVRCRMHDHMAAFIHVFDHPYFAVAKEDGTYSIPDAPAGKYTLVAWLEGFKEIRREIEIKAGAAPVDLEFARGGEGPTERTLAAGCCAAR